MQRFTLFVGKGGVGKTTVSSAYAIHRAAAAKRHKILLLSTDPAHSLGDILKVKLGDKPKRLPSAANLYARELDAERRVREFLEAERAPAVELLHRGSLFTADELDALLDCTLPGMAEVGAVLALNDLLDSDYDEIVVDTAPMGHAIRLFEMPQHLARFLDVLHTAAARDLAIAAQFGGRTRREPAVERWGRMVQRIQDALSRDGTRLVLITTPETFSLEEAARSAEMFGQNSIEEVVLNRVIAGARSCSRCKSKARQAEAARRFLRRHFPGAKVWVGRDEGVPIVGTDALAGFGNHIFSGAKLRLDSLVSAAPFEIVTKSAVRSGPKLERADWPSLRTRLTLTLGKGGVGKTTVSAGFAFHHRSLHADERVSICSIDPAPSLDDIFETEVGDQLGPVLQDAELRAAELDATAQYRHWAGNLREKINKSTAAERDGLHVDLSLDRNFLLALLEVVPPGVDELFAIFRILDMVESGDRVVIDMAPTGHAVEMLRTPERVLAWVRVLLKTLAAHRTLTFARDAAVELSKVSQRVRLLAAMLRDQRQCTLVIVTLPGELPSRETQRLLQSLRQMQAKAGCLFVNRVLMQPGGGACSRCRRQHLWQNSSLALARRTGQNLDVAVYIQKEYDREISGRKGLTRFTGDLWRLL